jgi:hypothetical protein
MTDRSPSFRASYIYEAVVQTRQSRGLSSAIYVLVFLTLVTYYRYVYTFMSAFYLLLLNHDYRDCIKYWQRTFYRAINCDDLNLSFCSSIYVSVANRTISQARGKLKVYNKSLLECFNQFIFGLKFFIGLASHR